MDVSAAAQEILGYLNFSSGMPDPKFLENVNKLFGWLVASAGRRGTGLAGLRACPPCRVAGGARHHRRLPPASSRPRPCWSWCSTACLPAYREFHRDLLFHQTDEALFQPFFIGRVCEAVLAAGRPVGPTRADRAGAPCAS